MPRPSRIKKVGPRHRGEKAARRLLEGRLRDVRGYEARAAALEEEGIHDLRVAIRRLRAALSHLAADRTFHRFEQRLRALQDALGEVRDVQLQLRWLAEQPEASAAGQALRRRLERALPRLERRLTAQLTGWQEGGAPGLSRQLVRGEVHALAKGRARRRLWKHAERLALEAAAPGLLADPHAAHQVRIRAKKLRYEAELLWQAYPEATEALLALLAPLQEALGALHDLDARAAALRKAARDPAAGQALEAERRRLAVRASRALSPWGSARRLKAVKRRFSST